MKNNILKKLNILKENLEGIELFGDCISTRDTEEDAKDYKKLDNRSCSGVHQKELGLYLLPFMSAPQEERKLDPVFLIANMDEWIKDESNIKRLLDFFDKESISFHSDYFGFDFDWSNMTIIGTGISHWDDWPGEQYNAMRSRLRCCIWKA